MAILISRSTFPNRKRIRGRSRQHAAWRRAGIQSVCLPPKRGLCGTVNHPARQNHRIIPITLDGKPWFFQYSPYVYYNEHCIVLECRAYANENRRRNFSQAARFREAISALFSWIQRRSSHCGGSILTHDHFQGGHYKFAMESAPIETPFLFSGYEEIEAGIVKWPMSVLRLRGTDEARLVELADRILQAWRAYTDEQAFVFAETEGTPHNTITPIARMSDGKLELDLCCATISPRMNIRWGISSACRAAPHQKGKHRTH